MTGDISKHLHACWKKAGIFYGKSIPKNLCCNMIRKSASTGIRKSQPTKFQEVSETMCNSTETAHLQYWGSHVSFNTKWNRRFEKARF